VLNNKYLWAIAVANAFVYFVRYGVVDWIPTYLQTAKGFSFQQSSAAWSAFEYSAIPGTILCGWISDKLFKGRRAARDDSLHGVHARRARRLRPQPPRSALDRHGALIAIGFFVYGPIMLIGLHALDLVPKKAAGTARDSRDFWLRLRLGNRGHRRRLDRRQVGLGRCVWPMIVCCLLTMVFSAMTLGHRTTSNGSPPK